MSWQDYVDNQLLASACVSRAAIAGHDGGVWAKSNGFEVSSAKSSLFKRSNSLSHVNHHHSSSRRETRRVVDPFQTKSHKRRWSWSSRLYRFFFVHFADIERYIKSGSLYLFNFVSYSFHIFSFGLFVNGFEKRGKMWKWFNLEKETVKINVFFRVHMCVWREWNFVALVSILI